MIFIINGEDTEIDLEDDMPLKLGMAGALARTQNMARSFEDWDLRDERGVVLDHSRTAADYGLTEKSRCYVSLQVGGGG